MHIINSTDLHAHPTLRPFAFHACGQTGKEANIRYKSPVTERIGIANYTQSDFISLRSGNVQVIFAALYPFEQAWFDPQNEIRRLEDKMLAEYLNLPQERISQILQADYNYFDELKHEYDFLVSQCELDMPPLAKIPSDWTDFENLLAQNETIIVIPTIEGAHAFISGNYNDILAGSLDFETIKNNILYVKEHTQVIFVTLAHHFYNGLVKHAKSFYGLTATIFNQRAGWDKPPITDIGRSVINCLLSMGEGCENTRPILIDIKHLSTEARREFYQIIADKGVPLIASHSAFSGIETLEQLKVRSVRGDIYHGFRTYEINLTVEDLANIYKSGGIIGIILDQKKLGRFSFWKWLFGGRLKWISLVVKNLMAMVERLVVDLGAKEEVWDLWTIGSDFDGIINPLDKYPTAAEIPLLAIDLKDALDKNRKFKAYNFGYSAEQVVEKILRTNSLNFIKRYYQQHFQA